MAFLKTDGSPLEDTSSLVESVAGGWWYAAAQPDGQLACVFFTDPDLHDNRALITEEHWWSILQQSTVTHNQIKHHNYYLSGDPFFRSANSSLLTKLFGENWLAVGDAAASYDPLSSHGLSFALVSGWDAAQTIHGHLDHVPYLLEHYGMVLQKAFIAYMCERFDYYGLEKRWGQLPFWERRQDEKKHLDFLEKILNKTASVV